jgi:DNA-binding NtrC family response regulator
VTVLVAARDVRVRRALSGLVELVDHRTVSSADTASLGPRLDAAVAPELVVLELDRGHETQDLQVIGQLADRGCSIIGVCSGLTSSSAVLAAGAEVCLDKDDAGFADRLAETVRTMSGRSAPDGQRRRSRSRPDR